MLSEEDDRQKLEKDILARSAEIYWDKDSGCFNKDAVSAFILAWRDLTSYYSNQARNHRAREDDNGQPIVESGLDISIGVEVVREYLYWLDRFANDPTEEQSRSCTESRRDAVYELRGAMRDIIAGVEDVLYPTGR